MTLVVPARSSAASAGTALVDHVLRALDRIPYWLIAIPLRIAVADVFWSSALTHVANWQTTLYQFENDYQVPLLPPTLAAYLAVTIESVTPPLRVLGLATRFASLILLGMTTVIEVFVYPQAWPTHIQWAAMLFVLLARGPGSLSLDALIRRHFLRGGV
jgi:putative oxidoreductase